MEVNLKSDGTKNENKVILNFAGRSLTLYFSYETIVGYRYNGEMWVCQNDWGSTTGKYLNRLEPDHKKNYSRRIAK